MYMLRVVSMLLLAPIVAPAQVPVPQVKAGDPAPVGEPARVMKLKAGMISALMRGGPWGLDLQPINPKQARKPLPDLPNYEPSYEVHITPTTMRGTQARSTDDRWIARGFTLKTLVLRAFRDETNTGCKNYRTASMATIVTSLQNQLHRPVIDETNLTGRYTFFATSNDKGPEAIVEILRN